MGSSSHLACACLDHELFPLYQTTFAFLWPWADWPQLFLSITLAPILIWLSISDLKTYTLPNTGTVLVAIVGAVFVAATHPENLLLHIGCAAAITGMLWLLGEVYFRRTGVEGLGIGDAKLFGAGTVLLGPWQLPELILFSSLGGIIGYAVSRRGDAAENGIPFGPFIAYAIFVLSFLNPIFI